MLVIALAIAIYAGIFQSFRGYCCPWQGSIYCTALAALFVIVDEVQSRIRKLEGEGHSVSAVLIMV